MPPPFRFDNGAAISKGARDYQEDAIIADFTSGAEVAIAVLSDGMGGHTAGDLASKIVVTEVFSELIFRRDDIAGGNAPPSDVLQGAANAANACIASHVAENPDCRGMGATLLGLLVLGGHLHWISIGDSPLFLFRDNVLHQLNEDHSLGPHIDFLVRTGALTAEQGRNHPERNALTSVLTGQKIAQVDCPAEPFALQAGDTLIIASDGLQFLSNDEIAQVIRERPHCQSAAIADALMSRLNDLNDPELDNVTLSIVQVHDAVRDGVPRAETPPAGALRVWPFRKRPAVASDEVAAEPLTVRGRH